MDPNWYEKSKVAGRYRKINNVEKMRIYEFRDNPTEAEKALWNILRNKKFHGLKFRRQHKIGQFIVDFYCHQSGMVIEVDGGVHDKRESEDSTRTEWLEKCGLKVIRFTNDEVLNDMETIKSKISSVISSLPQGDGGEFQKAPLSPEGGK
jgi:very-short-patch-repair endonuclease